MFFLNDFPVNLGPSLRMIPNGDDDAMMMLLLVMVVVTTCSLCGFTSLEISLGKPLFSLGIWEDASQFTYYACQ